MAHDSSFELRCCFNMFIVDRSFHGGT
jgi:hypothetical protein